MEVLAFFAVLVFIVIAVTIGKPILKSKRRQLLMMQPFPPNLEKILEDKVFIYRHLQPAFKARLKQLINVFLDEKHFEGCDGLVITDEVRVVIAAEACLLMLNGKPHFYPTLSSVLVYPHAYVVNTVERIGQSHVESEEVRAGESWLGGEIVLAWDLVEREAGGLDDGHGVALHEFAHQLDQEDGSADGAPQLGLPSRYTIWARVLGSEFESLKDDVENGRESFLDDYGAKNPAEFFAVATETFFRNPTAMKAERAALYEQLREYYRVDPAEWIRSDSTLLKPTGAGERVVVR
ncbi:MAG: M90 family metallopeptidase, partial [bacterium]